ncbi:MAG: hypothetical protein FJ044_04405 [Candidatus Cloacimonetes bacterium]|nr:hypothetical protein [Candidatus Cloacimonadota bacterium]
MENLDPPEADKQTEANTQENLASPPAGISFFTKLKTNWPIVLGILGSLAIFFVFIYAVFSYSRRGQEIQPMPMLTVVPTPTTAVAVIPLVTSALTSILTPITQFPTPVIDIPTDWNLETRSLFSIGYPSDWYVWLMGRGVDIDYWQVNNIPDEENIEKQPEAFLSVDITRQDQTSREKMTEVKETRTEVIINGQTGYDTGYQYEEQYPNASIVRSVMFYKNQDLRTLTT